MKEVRSHQENTGGLTVSECYFIGTSLPKYVTLRLVERASSPEARDPRTVWNESFAPEKLEALKRARGKAKRDAEAVPNLGDEAFWMGETKAGGLFVLRKNAYIRVLIGSSDDRATKIKKCMAIAKKALGRL